MEAQSFVIAQEGKPERLPRSGSQRPLGVMNLGKPTGARSSMAWPLSPRSVWVPSVCPSGRFFQAFRNTDHNCFAFCGTFHICDAGISFFTQDTSVIVLFPLCVDKPSKGRLKPQGGSGRQVSALSWSQVVWTLSLQHSTGFPQSLYLRTEQIK